MRCHDRWLAFMQRDMHRDMHSHQGAYYGLDYDKELFRFINNSS